MRALAAPALLVALVLAGCAGPDGAGPGEAEGEEGRRSVGGGPDGNGTDVPHTKVTLLSATVDLIGPDATATFDVVVPDNVTNVDFKISAGGPGGAALFSMFRIELAGCGFYDQGAGFSAGTITLAGRLCKDGPAGALTLTLGNSGYVQGAPLTLTGQVPKPADNGTASASSPSATGAPPR